MSSAGLAIRTAIFARLSTTTAITAALGGARIYDDVPTRAEFPYIVFTQSTERDWSTATDIGHEHVVTLHVWSRANGRRDVDVVVGAVQAALHDQALVLVGHRLINLRHEFSETRRDSDGEAFHAVVRFRAVTEKL